MENMQQEYFKQTGRRAVYVGYEDRDEWEPSYILWLEKLCASKNEEAAKTANNKQSHEICAHCKVVSAVHDYYPLAYRYCPYCGRKLSGVC